MAYPTRGNCFSYSEKPLQLCNIRFGFSVDVWHFPVDCYTGRSESFCMSTCFKSLVLDQMAGGCLSWGTFNYCDRIPTGCHKFRYLEPLQIDGFGNGCFLYTWAWNGGFRRYRFWGFCMQQKASRYFACTRWNWNWYGYDDSKNAGCIGVPNVENFFECREKGHQWWFAIWVLLSSNGASVSFQHCGKCNVTVSSLHECDLRLSCSFVVILILLNVNVETSHI